jgi:mRNA-degrading endonuclease RelE of RelBE toxin-antitoxin system
MKNIEEIIRELPPELRREVEDFVQTLVAKQKRKTGVKLRQDWAGALRDFRDQYTSLELQKKALEWRGD